MADAHAKLIPYQSQKDAQEAQTLTDQARANKIRAEFKKARNLGTAIPSVEH